MLAQVSGVLDGTIVSAEEWCERLGKEKQRGEPTAAQQFHGIDTVCSTRRCSPAVTPFPSTSGQAVDD